MQVLAYRGRLWTSLRYVCEILWDQFNIIAFHVECSQNFESPSTLTLDQFYTVITPLLVLASELLMDMMEKLQVISDSMHSSIKAISYNLICLVSHAESSLFVAVEGV